ncbi:hypothetical protein [Nocardia sp. NPDC057440]|uniref:hypothetical protein n=1 Tax=Nocardia sp. NPDC057440 TaxID=3346134 RepID=UPI00367339DB
MTGGNDQFMDAVADFERAVHADESADMAQAHGMLRQLIGDANPAALTQAGPRLAAVLEDVPLGGRADIAVMIGYCVEVGADPVSCAPPVLTNLAQVLDGAMELIEQASAIVDLELPAPEDIEEGSELLEVMFESFGPSATLSWLTLSPCVTASLSMLQRKAVRQGLGPIRELLTQRYQAYLEASGANGKDIDYALLVLDDEPLIVLDRDTGTGYRLRMSGIADNFQLQTLLGDALIGGGHLAGEPPSAEAVAVSRDSDGRVPTVCSFKFHAPDGTRIWNEGTPSDIPVVDGARVLVLDEIPYPHHFPALRYFPSMLAELELDRALSPTECATWFAHVGPAER